MTRSFLDNSINFGLNTKATFLWVSDSELAVDGDIIHRGFVKDEVEAADDVGQGHVDLCVSEAVTY